MLFIFKDACNPAHIMVVHKIKQMHPLIERPLFRPILPCEGMADFKHIHTVKARMHSVVTFIIRDRMAHLLICPLLIVPVQRLTDQKEVFF